MFFRNEGRPVSRDERECSRLGRKAGWPRGWVRPGQRPDEAAEAGQGSVPWCSRRDAPGAPPRQGPPRASAPARATLRHPRACAVERLAGRQCGPPSVEGGDTQPAQGLAGTPRTRVSATHPTLLPGSWSKCRYRGDRVVAPKLSSHGSPRSGPGQRQAAGTGADRPGARKALGMEPGSGSGSGSGSRLRPSHPSSPRVSRRKQD